MSSIDYSLQKRHQLILDSDFVHVAKKTYRKSENSISLVGSVACASLIWNDSQK